MSHFPADLTPAQLLFPDLATELALTRGMIAKVPDGNDDFRPHEKSMKLGGLATHLAELPGFAKRILTTDELDWGKEPWTPTIITSTAERVALFDTHAAEMTEAVEGSDWAALDKRWVMRQGDQVFLDEGKAKLIRTFALSHIAHHRAQLGVYLRLLGVAIPGTYGPSADEM
jgi:uncharacterized damage-inducible protein DinB